MLVFMCKISVFLFIICTLLTGCNSVKESDPLAIQAIRLQIGNNTIDQTLDSLFYQVFDHDGKIVAEPHSGNIQRRFGGETLQKLFKDGIYEELPEGDYQFVFAGFANKTGKFATVHLLSTLSDTLFFSEADHPIDGDYFHARPTLSTHVSIQSVVLQRKTGRVILTLDGESDLLSKISNVSFSILSEYTSSGMLADGTLLPSGDELQSYSQKPNEACQIAFYSLPTKPNTGCYARIEVNFDNAEPSREIYLFPDDGFYVEANRTTKVHLQLAGKDLSSEIGIKVDADWGATTEIGINGEIDLTPGFITGFRLQIRVPENWDFENTQQNQTGAKSMYDFDRLILQDRDIDIPSINASVTPVDDRTVLSDIIPYTPYTLTPYSIFLMHKTGGNAHANLGSHNIRWSIPVIKDKVCTYAITISEVAINQITLLKEEQIAE